MLREHILNVVTTHQKMLTTMWGDTYVNWSYCDQYLTIYINVYFKSSHCVLLTYTMLYANKSKLRGKEIDG